MTLRRSACAPSDGMSLPRLETFLRFLSQHLSAADCSMAESLLHEAIDPVWAARRNRERAGIGV